MQLREITNLNLPLNVQKIIIKILIEKQHFDGSNLKIDELSESLIFLLKNDKIKLNFEKNGFVLKVKSFKRTGSFKEKLIINEFQSFEASKSFKKLQSLKPYARAYLYIYINNFDILSYKYLIYIYKKLFEAIINQSFDIESTFKSLFLFDLDVKAFLKPQVLKSFKKLQSFDFLSLKAQNLVNFNIPLSKSNFNKIKYLENFILFTQKLKAQKLKSFNFEAQKLKSFNFEAQKLKSFNQKASKNIKLGVDSTLFNNFKKEKSLKRRKKNDEVKSILTLLKEKIIEYNKEIGATSYFPHNWEGDNRKIAYHMLSTLESEEIIYAINWFFTDKFWKGKIDSLKMVSKHYQKYLSNRVYINNPDALLNAINRRVQN